MSEIEKVEEVVQEEFEEEEVVQEEFEEEEEEEEEEIDDREGEGAGEEENETGEEATLDHWIHDHPLTLVVTCREDTCYGCGRHFRSGELGYGCKNKCGYENLLHEECAEMVKKIRDHMHPQHMLIQKENYYGHQCAICEKDIWGFGYYCTITECKFQMHIGCAQDKGLMNATEDDDEDEQRRVVVHPSHPQHELRLLGRRSSFRCDACGTKKLGNSYLCITCQYWIHCTCASLADTIKREDHHHSLSLSFDVPPEYIKFDYKCDVCFKELQRKYWIYHCHLCRYAVHIKCAFKNSPHATTTTSNNETGKDIIWFPVNDVAGKQIRAFVMKFGGILMPPILDGNDVKHYTFNHHKHQLSLISSSNIEEEEEEEENNDEEDNDYTYKSKLVCDGCINPIIFQRERSNYYLSCSSCKYYIHWECFHLPPQLPSLTPLHEPDHQLVLQYAPKLDFGFEFICSVCLLPMNGLFYACRRCEFKADIKCASLPNTIYHSAHPHHLLNLLNWEDILKGNYSWRLLQCDAGCNFGGYDFYVCDSCEFMLHVRCAMLPPSVRDRRWDKHLLPLTYDAYVNHPDEFYCDHCEEQMNPKRWMYHCRPCDLSFHPDCFKAASGEYRNIKFGQQYHMNSAHPHPLTFQLLTTKRRCDVCRMDAYTCTGFHCASCNFFICFYNCVRTKRLEDRDIHAVD